MLENEAVFTIKNWVEVTVQLSAIIPNTKIKLFKMASIDSLPTPTVVRIKRRIGSESSENIIVSSKRKRLSENDCQEMPDIYTAIFKKFTTLQNGDSLEVETKKAVLNEVKHSWELKKNYKQGATSSAKDLVQKRTKSDIQAIRFRLVCSKRNLDVVSEEKEKESSNDDADFHLLDALKEKEEQLSLALPCSSQNTDIIACNGVPMQFEKVEYVYDLYYTSLPIEISSWINNICEIQRYNALDYTDEMSKANSEEVYNDDEDDENEEANWRNDYPDEEEGDLLVFEDEDDICQQLQKTKINDSDESYDADDYDESGDFDEDGNLIVSIQPSSSVFGWPMKKKQAPLSSASESDEQ